MFNQELNNLKREEGTMPAKRSTDCGQKGWPGASHQKASERQWLKPENPNWRQQQMDEQTISSAAIRDETEENSSIDMDDEWFTAEEDAANDENEPMRMEMEEDVEKLEMLPVANSDVKAKNEPQKFENLIHSRQLLEGVLCPWEKIQQFIRMHPNDYWKMLTMPIAGRFIEEVLVAFNVLGKGKMVYIDQINELGRGIIHFEHYGDIEIDTILPHYGQISEEDFERWLCKLIANGNELPRTNAKCQARRQFLEFLNDLNFPSISGRVQNPKMLFDGMVEQINGQILQPFALDISPIILRPNHFNSLLKLCQQEFRELLIGLYLEVKISEIASSIMKLPPMLQHMFVPISMVTFDAPKHYKVLHMAKQATCNVMVHVKNAKGDVICSAMLPREMKLSSSKELVPNSVAIWQMNNIALPTFDHVQQKTQQLERAFVLAKEIKFIREKGTFPLPFHGRRIFVEKAQTKKEERKANIQARRAWQKAEILKMAASIGIVGNGDGQKQEIGQLINVLKLNCQMPPNFVKIVLKPAQFWQLHQKLTIEQLKKLVVGMFVHVKIPQSFKLYSLIDLKGHLIVPIAVLICKKKSGKNKIYIRFHERIKLCNEKGILKEKISIHDIEANCEERLIEECAFILNKCKISPPSEEFIARKECELCHWL